MFINKANLNTLYTAFKTAFSAGFAGVVPVYKDIAMVVPSTTGTGAYASAAGFPLSRE